MKKISTLLLSAITLFTSAISFNVHAEGGDIRMGCCHRDLQVIVDKVDKKMLEKS